MGAHSSVHNGHELFQHQSSASISTGWGISRLTPLYPTNGLSYAPGSQYIVVGGKAYTASQVRTTSLSWDKGVLTDLCHTRVLTDLGLTLYFTYKHETCHFNPLMPNDLYMRRTAQLISRRCILYIYSTNIRTEYFKHAA